MRMIAALAIAAATISSAAVAAPANVPQSTASVQIKGSVSRVHMNDDQFAGFKGQYQLSNGKVLTVSSNNTRYFAQIDGQRAVEIVPTSDKSFMSANSGIALTFAVHPDGFASDVIVASRN